MKLVNVIKFLSLLLLSQLVIAANVHAQATRTWVSGVGDDANPCSRTAPCKTFAGAISKTATAGEINVLDPGGFGAVTVTKSITISSEGDHAGVLAAGTNGIVINGAGIVVVLRRLDIEGVGTGINGIRIVQAGAVHVEDCTINNFTESGIDARSTTPATLFVKDTIIRNGTAVNATGVSLIPPVGSSVSAILDNVRVERNKKGIVVNSSAFLTLKNSSIFGNFGNGVSVVAASGTALASIDDTIISNNNGDGVRSEGASARVRISRTSIYNNLVGLKSQTSGEIVSFSNNTVFGNGVEGAPTAILPLK